MTGGLSPEEYGQLQEHAAYAGFIIAVFLFGALLAVWAAYEAWQRHHDRKARERAAWAALAAAQLQAGIHAGWHDNSPADRRRNR